MRDNLSNSFLFFVIMRGLSLLFASAIAVAAQCPYMESQLEARSAPSGQAYGSSGSPESTEDFLNKWVVNDNNTSLTSDVSISLYSSYLYMLSFTGWRPHR